MRALSALGAPRSDSRLVFWTDASVKKASTGWAAVFREGYTWVRIMARGPGGTSSNIAELQAIGLALDYVIQFVEKKTESDEKGRLQILEVYTDSKVALNFLRKILSDLPPWDIDEIDDSDDTKANHYNKKKRVWLLTQMIAQEVGRKATKLQEAGVCIELNWVPRDTVIGNKLADKGAALARMGVGCDYTLNNALIEFLPADPVGEGDEDQTSVCL
jgi:ribonuclease HI